MTHANMDLSALEIAGPRKLDIGCGDHPLGGDWIGVDAIAYPNVQIVGDATEVLGAIEPETIDAIYASHFLEHVDDLPGMLSLMARVLKPRSHLTVRVPHWSHAYYWSDPTHRRPFGLYTFDYLAKSDLFSRRLPDYGYGLPLELVNAEFNFMAVGPIGRVVQRIVNRSSRTQEIYEGLLAPIIGCFELRFVLEKL